MNQKINYNKIIFCFTMLIVFSLNGNAYLDYLQNNGFKTLATIITELANINKENISLKSYNENKVERALVNFTAEYQKELIAKIKQEYKKATEIDFDDKEIKDCFLKGVIREKQIDTFFVSSDNHTSLNFFTNVLDENYHVYLGDTIDKKRQFENEKTLEKLSIILLFTHITKGLFENIINQGKNAIYCAGNHDIGWCFNHDESISTSSTRKNNDEIIIFLKKAVRLTNFIECIIFNEDSIFNFNHGAGKSNFKNKKYIIDENNKKIYFATAMKEEKIDDEAIGGFDINATWCGPHNISLEKDIPMFKKSTIDEYQILFQNKEKKEALSEKRYFKFFGHAHPDFLKFENYFLNNLEISFKIMTSTDKKNNMVFLPPSYHDNRFGSKIDFFKEYLKKNLIKTSYSFSSLPTTKTEIQQQEINPHQNQTNKKIPNKKKIKIIT